MESSTFKELPQKRRVSFLGFPRQLLYLIAGKRNPTVVAITAI